ncbi:unnamed protein product, partial [marine sediment metagenome]
MVREQVEKMELKNVGKKLGAIQAALVAPKGHENTFGGYKYRSCEDILEAVKPLLAEHDCIVTLTDTIVQLSTRYYVRATACITDLESGESIFVDAFAREAESQKGMQESQLTGATSSYARKYALNGLFAIDDCKDADTTNVGDDCTPVSIGSKPVDGGVPGEGESGGGAGNS